MAGGAGTRLWPMSRNSRPKQLLPLISREGTKHPVSLLELAVERVEGLIPTERRYICTGEGFRAQIRKAIPALKDGQILGEPMGRDTVNAVGFSAAVLQKLDKDAVFVVLTADHIIEPREDFQKLMEIGFRLVETDKSRLVTFSIKPTYPSTGFGYVERGSEITGVNDAQGRPIARGLAYRVERFVEKPDQPRAQAYVESGHFGWNSGMFVFHAGTFLDCLKKYKPESHEGLMKIQSAWGTAKQKAVLDEVYPTLPRISVDYAVMEPASREHRVCTVVSDVKWLDVGSWPSYGETLDPDADGNRVGGGGVHALIVDGKNNLVVGEGAGEGRGDTPPHTIALLGVKDLIVVHTPDATLVMPRDKAEQLKKLHALVVDDLK